MRALALLCACSVASYPSSKPVVPCIAPASGQAVLDETGVRELLAGVAIEEGELASQRDQCCKRAQIAESYAQEVQAKAAGISVGATVFGVVVSVLLTYFLTKQADK